MVRQNLKIVGIPIIVIALFIGFVWAFAIPDPSFDPVRRIPIQHVGQVKSFDTFSRELLRLLCLKETWEGEAAHIPVLRTLSDPEKAFKNPWISCTAPEPKSFLGLDQKRNFFSYNEIAPFRHRIETLVRSAKEKRDQDIRPARLEQKAEELFTQLVTLEELNSGRLFKVIPSPNLEGWGSLEKPLSPKAAVFLRLIRSFLKDPGSHREDLEQWIEEVHENTEYAWKLKIAFEMAYTDLRPFQTSGIAYLVAFILLSFFYRYRTPSQEDPFAFHPRGGNDSTPGVEILAKAGWFAFILAFGFHTAGILLRVVILNRPPVSNMYESMIFMNWALMALAIPFSLYARSRSPVAAGALASALIMIYADLLPISPSLETLVPVLRSNRWLSIHVMTVVSSYGAFGLALALGHRHLILDTLGKHRGDTSSRSAELIYRVMQVGMLLLGAGTVLGGVWANESWGRFWGWDPKETWALITFLAYLVVVHLRHTNRLGDFSLALSSILGFQFVLMTWYGVNFVLGRGLHSYGAGSGGMIWILIYLLLETLFLAAILIRKTTREAKILSS